MWLPGIKWDASSPCGSSLLLILPATNGTSLCARGRFRCLLVDVAELRVVGRAGGHAAQRLVGFKHCKNGTKEAGNNHRRVLAWSTFDIWRLLHWHFPLKSLENRACEGELQHGATEGLSSYFWAGILSLYLALFFPPRPAAGAGWFCATSSGHREAILSPLIKCRLPSRLWTTAPANGQSQSPPFSLGRSRLWEEITSLISVHAFAAQSSPTITRLVFRGLAVSRMIFVIFFCILID